MSRLPYFGPHGISKMAWQHWRKKWNAKNSRPPTLFPQAWMKIVKPTSETAPNTIQFECSHNMNKFEIKDYLQTIYNVDVVKVNTQVMDGERYMYQTAYGKLITHTNPHKKIVWVTLSNQQFIYPDYWNVSVDSMNEEKIELTEDTVTLDGKNKELTVDTDVLNEEKKELPVEAVVLDGEKKESSGSEVKELSPPEEKKKSPMMSEEMRRETAKKWFS